MKGQRPAAPKRTELSIQSGGAVLYDDDDQIEELHLPDEQTYGHHKTATAANPRKVQIGSRFSQKAKEGGGGRNSSSNSSVRGRKTIRIVARKKPKMLDTDEQGDQNIMTTIEMETYRSQRSATSGNMERQGSSTKQTISNSNQI